MSYRPISIYMKRRIARECASKVFNYITEKRIRREFLKKIKGINLCHGDSVVLTYEAKAEFKTTE